MKGLQVDWKRKKLNRRLRRWPQIKMAVRETGTRENYPRNLRFLLCKASGGLEKEEIEPQMKMAVRETGTRENYPRNLRLLYDKAHNYSESRR